MNGDDITMLDAQIVPDHTVHPGTSIVQVIISKHDENCVFSLLALDQDGIASEQL